MKYNFLKEEVEKSIKDNRSLALAAVSLGMPFTSFRRLVFKIDEGLWNPNPGGKGWRVPANTYTKKRFEVEVLKENSSRLSSYKIKNLIFKFKMKKEICEICGQLPEWKGKKLVLQLDHIDGDRWNNKLENLRIVCPNCHTQTENFVSKNKNYASVAERSTHRSQKPAGVIP